MRVSPATFEFGSETRSSVTPATGSKGGDGLRLSMAVSCADTMEDEGQSVMLAGWREDETRGGCDKV